MVAQARLTARQRQDLSEQPLPPDQARKRAEIDESTVWEGKKLHVEVPNAYQYPRWYRVVIVELDPSEYILSRGKQEPQEIVELDPSEYILSRGKQEPQETVDPQEMVELGPDERIHFFLELLGNPLAPRPFYLIIQEFETEQQAGPHQNIPKRYEWIPIPQEEGVRVEAPRRVVNVRPWRKEARFPLAVANRGYLPATVSLWLGSPEDAKAGFPGVEPILELDEPLPPMQQQWVECAWPVEGKPKEPQQVQVTARGEFQGPEVPFESSLERPVEIHYIPFPRLWYDWVMVGVAAFLAVWLVMGMPPYIRPEAHFRLQFGDLLPGELPPGVDPSDLAVTLLVRGKRETPYKCTARSIPDNSSKTLYEYEYIGEWTWRGFFWTWKNLPVFLKIQPAREKEFQLRDYELPSEKSLREIGQFHRRRFYGFVFNENPVRIPRKYLVEIGIPSLSDLGLKEVKKIKVTLDVEGQEEHIPPEYPPSGEVEFSATGEPTPKKVLFNLTRYAKERKVRFKASAEPIEPQFPGLEPWQAEGEVGPAGPEDKGPLPNPAQRWVSFKNKKEWDGVLNLQETALTVKMDEPRKRVKVVLTSEEGRREKVVDLDSTTPADCDLLPPPGPTYTVEIIDLEQGKPLRMVDPSGRLTPRRTLPGTRPPDQDENNQDGDGNVGSKGQVPDNHDTSAYIRFSNLRRGTIVYINGTAYRPEELSEIPHEPGTKVQIYARDGSGNLSRRVDPTLKPGLNTINLEWPPPPPPPTSPLEANLARAANPNYVKLIMRASRRCYVQVYLHYSGSRPWPMLGEGGTIDGVDPEPLELRANAPWNDEWPVEGQGSRLTRFVIVASTEPKGQAEFDQCHDRWMNGSGPVQGPVWWVKELAIPSGESIPR